MDTRIELAAQALCEMDGKAPEGEALERARTEATRFVRLLDAVTPPPKADDRHLRRPGMMRRGGPMTQVG